MFANLTILLLRALVLIFSIVTVIIGLTGHLFDGKLSSSSSSSSGGGDDREVHVGMFRARLDVFDNAFRNSSSIVNFSTAELPCQAIRHRLGGAAGLAITAVILQGFLLLNTAVEIFCTSNTKKVNATFWFAHAVSLICGLISWALCVAIFRGGFCSNAEDSGNVLVDFGAIGRDDKADGMKIAFGLSLFIAGWGAQFSIATLLKMASNSLSSSSSDSKKRVSSAKKD